MGFSNGDLVEESSRCEAASEMCWLLVLLLVFCLLAEPFGEYKSIWNQNIERSEEIYGYLESEENQIPAVFFLKNTGEAVFNTALFSINEEKRSASEPQNTAVTLEVTKPYAEEVWTDSRQTEVQSMSVIHENAEIIEKTEIASTSETSGEVETTFNPETSSKAEIATETGNETMTDSKFNINEAPALEEEIVHSDITAQTDVEDVPDLGVPDSEEISSELTVINGFGIDEEGMICEFYPEKSLLEEGFLEFPAEYCTGIRRGVFTEGGYGITDLYIPSNITMIEDGAFSELVNLGYIDVEEGNPVYMGVDGVLFDSTMTEVKAFPASRIGFYEMPENVVRIGDYALENTMLSKIDLRNCTDMEVGNYVFGEFQGEGITIYVPQNQRELYSGVFAGYSIIME